MGSRKKKEKRGTKEEGRARKQERGSRKEGRSVEGREVMEGRKKVITKKEKSQYPSFRKKRERKRKLTDPQFPLTTDLHSNDTLVPSSDDLSSTESEAQRRSLGV